MGLTDTEKQDVKVHIEGWLPLMKEIEAAGYNPVQMLFEPLSMEKMEITYKALHRAKIKYPEWYKAMAPVTDWMKGIEK